MNEFVMQVRILNPRFTRKRKR